jgi:hypothetical protein
VELTFSDNFVVEATGNLTNNDEVLPEALRDKLDIANFKTKPWNSAPSVITPYDKAREKLGNIMQKMCMILPLLPIPLTVLMNLLGVK